MQGVPKRQLPVYLCLGRSPATFFLAPLPPADCIAWGDDPSYYTDARSYCYDASSWM